jgi:short-subunit dehydrogenase
MDTRTPTRGRAIVTGASSGIGLAFARRLAAGGYDLSIVARGAARLTEVANELTEQYGVAVEPLVADLASAEGQDAVVARLESADDAAILVNNAGFGVWGTFASTDEAKHLAMIDVHVIASVRLCRAVVPGMIARRRGVIVNVSSLAAFVPTPNNVTYSAAKAYLLSFSQGLRSELRGTGVRVQALCPGLTHTGFHTASDYSAFPKGRIPAALWQSPEDVVSASLRALRRNQTVCVPGLPNRLVALLARTGLPGWVASRRG